MPVPGPKESSTIVSMAAGSFHPGALEGLLEKAQELSPRQGRVPQAGYRAKPCREKSFTEQSPAGRLVLRALVTQQAPILALFQMGSKRNLPNPS